jgi:hypothetical protein
LLKGAATNWADGVAFFSDSRTYGSNTIDNYTTSAFSATSFEAAYTAMASFVGHSNKPLGVRPMYLLHGPKLHAKAQEICNDLYAARTVDASTIVQGLNPWKGSVTPVQSPHLVDGIVVNGVSYNAADYWFLMGSSAGLMGLVYQDRLAPELQAQKWNPNSEFTFDTDNAPGDAARVHLPHPEIFASAQVGDNLLLKNLRLRDDFEVFRMKLLRIHFEEVVMAADDCPIEFSRHKPVAADFGIHFSHKEVACLTDLLLLGADCCAVKILSQHNTTPMQLNATEFVARRVVDRDAALAVTHDFTQRGRFPLHHSDGLICLRRAVDFANDF